MQVSNHQRRRLASPAALAVYGALLAAGTAAGVWANVELGARGFAAVPIGLIVPGAGGLGLVGVIIGRSSTRPPGGPIRPAPTSRPAITRATVTAVTSQAQAPADLAFTPSNVLGRNRPEVSP